MGVCSCQTTLRRDLAEELILNAIAERILSNSYWVDLLFDLTLRSFEQLRKERPSRRKVVEETLADLDGRVGNLLKNCEKEVVPEIEQRLAELRNERQALRLELKQLVAEAESTEGPPTRE
jgi:hypothetical protein